MYFEYSDEGYVPGKEISIDENTLEVEVKKGQSLNTVFHHLSQHAINITSMRNKTNRLEELFVKLVNKGAAWTFSSYGWPTPL